MKNTIGTSVCLTLFGESHGGEIGAVLDGMAPGIPVREEEIAAQLARRRPQGDLSTARREADAFRIVSGVYGGYTTGAPIAILIPNSDTRSADYAAVRDVPRPGHADYTARCKYHGFEDSRGGGHFSGRLTAPLVAAGAIARRALMQRNIVIGTHIAECAGVKDRALDAANHDLLSLAAADFPVLDEKAGERMRAAIRAAKAAGDSVGGILETVVTGVPAGVGEPWFDSVEGDLARALFAIPAVKGVEFGDGFGFAALTGSRANDPLRITDGVVAHTANHNGGINGGVTNGMPLLYRVCVKPTPTVGIPQESVDLKTGENAVSCPGGRHDPAILHRACPVVDAVSALILCDLLALRFGTDWLCGERK